MKRFYGAAVFEGEEVSDYLYPILQNIRAEETRGVELAEREVQKQCAKLALWRKEELARIDSEAERDTNEQERIIAAAHAEIVRIEVNAQNLIRNIHQDFSLAANIKKKEVLRITQEAEAATHHQENSIYSAQRELSMIRTKRSSSIAITHETYITEYNIRVDRRDKAITMIHEEAAYIIRSIIALRYYLPVYMMRCAKGPCEFCRAKYGTTGTLAQLENSHCVPPFHDDCRCWLEIVGYVVMFHSYRKANVPIRFPI